MSVSGTKQGRRDWEGTSRQEGEKPWRRSVVGIATPAYGISRVHLPGLER
jgi:hypothetical protein